MAQLKNAYALVVGVANYLNINPLPPTVLNDAQAVHSVLVDESLCAYPPDNVTLLLDDKATLSAIKQALEYLTTKTGPESTVFIYVSSHGGRLDAGPHAGEYLLPVDVQYTDDETLANTAISGADFTTALHQIPAAKLVVVFDCCHSGGIGQPKALTTTPAIFKNLPHSFYETLQGGRGRVILASSESTELSWILPGATNSLFTAYLVDGLRGAADGSGGVIRIFDLFDYVQPRVTASRGDQHPIFKAELRENFPVALYRGGQKAATSPPAAAQGDGYLFDVFVSYSQQSADRQWVRSTLVPRLEAAGIRVAVEYRAPLGVPIIEAREQMVKQSRYTVSVLSPAYLESGLSAFENLIAQHLGLEASEYRLLPVLREPCTPRLGLRMLPILDLSTADDFDWNIDRLLSQLMQPPQRRQA